jgi:hypothetical protein
LPANVSVFDWYQYVFRILGGWMAGVYGGFTSSAEFIDGAQRDFIPFHIVYAFPKTLILMLLATIPSFHGYMKGGALEVGKQVQLPLFGHRFL